MSVYSAGFLPCPCDFLYATVDHSWDLRRLSCKIRLFPWLPCFFREVCHESFAHRSLNRPKICFPTVQDCNSAAGSLVLFAYSLLSSLHHPHCHQPLPPQMALLCLSVGFASLLVKQENASLAGSLVTCDLHPTPEIFVLCSAGCSWNSTVCLWVGQKCDLADLCQVSPHPMHLAAKMDSSGLSKTGILNINLLKDGECFFWEEVLRWKMRGLAVWQKQRRT